MNNSSASGFFDEAKGKVKQAVGETFNNQKLANEGAADELKGHAEQTWGSVKDTAHDIAHSQPTTPYDPSNPSYSTDPVYNEDLQQEGHNLRTGLTHAAENIKDSIQRGLDHIDHSTKH